MSTELKVKVLQVLNTRSRLDYIELFKIAFPTMLQNKYMRSQQYPALLNEMAKEGLIAEDGFIERFVMPRRIKCGLYIITEEGKEFLNSNLKLK